MAWSEATAVSTGTATRAAPTVITEGFSLGGCRNLRVFLAAVAAQTLSGAGSLNAWLWHPTAGVWARNPDLDLPVSTLVAGKQGQAWQDLQILVLEPGYRGLWAPNGVTVSGGASVTTYVGLGTAGT